jgi:sugar lactone lactonase YvrE
MEHELICAWLHLPAGSWPPDHYTLLGLEPGEADVRRIEEQAGARMQQVRRYQLTYPEPATEAMNRLAQALVCLTDPEARRAYDARLRVRQPARAGARGTAPPAEEDRTPAPLATLPWSGLNGRDVHAPLAEPGRPRLPAWVWLVQSVGLVCVLGGLALAGVWAWTATHPDTPGPSANDGPAGRTPLLKELHGFTTEHIGTVQSVAFSPDGRLVLLADEQALRLLNLDTSTETTAFEPRVRPAASLAFAPGGESFLVNEGKVVWLCSVGKRKPPQLLADHEGSVTCVAFSPDGRRSLSGSEDRTVLLWDCTTRKELQRLTGFADAVTCVAFTADGRRAVAAGKDHTVRSWDADTGKALPTLRGAAPEFTIVAFAADGRSVLSSDGAAVRLYEIETGQQVRRLDGEPGRVTSLALAADGHRALAGTEGGTVTLWDVDSGRELGRCAGHSNAVLSVAFGRDGRRALTGGQDGTVRVWQLP